MPLYEYKCKKCFLKFERNLKISDSDNIPCPNCKEITQKLPPQNVMGAVKESTSIPKDVDKIVGKDSEEKWNDYEERKQLKEKVKKEAGTGALSRDSEGNYSPLEITKDGEKVSESEGIKLRKEMYDEYSSVKNDPNTEKAISSD